MTLFTEAPDAGSPDMNLPARSPAATRLIWRLVCVAIFFLLAIPALKAADRPNVLIILGDDCTFRDLPIHGGQNAFTPNLQQLASDGLTFNHAYLTTAMCQPCRAELYTGQFPMRNGCSWNHSASHPDVISMPQHLESLGYRVGLAGKVHVKPASVFPFEHVDGFDPNCVRDPTRVHSLDGCREFITRDDDQPFCLVVALVDPHVPWVMGDRSRYPDREIKLPPNIADNPITRDAFARYLAEITYMDGQVGDLVELVDRTNHRKDTLVLFSSEQGAQFPGCKWTNWDTGVHTSMVARMPGVVPSDKRTDAIVQYADVLPTIIELAGGNSWRHPFDGNSFKDVLLGKSDTHRDYAFAAHNNIPEGPAYPVRSISNGTYRYVRNLQSQNIFIEKHLMGIQGNGKLNNRYWQAWVWQSANDEHAYDLVQRYVNRPAEQLYCTAEDPYELNNRIDDPTLQQIRSELSDQLDRWMESGGDPGVELDTRASHQAAKNGQHRFLAPAK